MISDRVALLPAGTESGWADQPTFTESRSELTMGLIWIYVILAAAAATELAAGLHVLIDRAAIRTAHRRIAGRPHEAGTAFTGRRSRA